ncbi:MAG TPA: 2-hydroxyacid dehydrogenase [Flavisolibacter sp.]|nr:2-hydroxyacid dehydrogenase [Flavisolibacter sp.]
MKVLFYSSKEYELPYLRDVLPPSLDTTFIPELLSAKTAPLCKGYDAISIFTSDDASSEVITLLKKNGIRYISVRAAGYDNVAIQAANRAGIVVGNVPEYSPYAIAEHTVALMLALNRKLIRSHQQVHQHNFTLDHLTGFDLHKKKVGIIGTGRIGSVVAKILHGFGCTLMAYDVNRNQSLEHKYNVFYTSLDTLCSFCDIITIHLPLNEQTRYLINKRLIDQMKRGVMLINTSRGAVIQTKDVLDALPSGQIGYLGLDVYEYEKGVFLYDRSNDKLTDTTLDKLMSYSNVMITPHQAFATEEALSNIAGTTVYNLTSWAAGRISENELTYIEIHSPSESSVTRVTQ